MKKNNSVRLVKASQVKRFIANVMNQCNQDEISESKARTLTYMASIQLRAIEVADLEQKVKELENLVEELTSSE